MENQEKIKYNFIIIGGDKRNLNLAKKLSTNENKVKIFGFNRIKKDYFVNNNIEEINSIEQLKEILKENKIRNNKYNKTIIIGAIPLTKDNVNIYMPFNDEEVSLQLLKNEEFIAGKIPKEWKNDKNKIDILDDEYFTIMNTIPTAEGAIQKAIELTNFNIDKSNVMVLGFGRVGKTLCYKLKNLGANVYAEARKEKDLAWINVYGYTPVKFEDISKKICKMDIIFNTIPELILDKSRLVLLSKETLIIDLASKGIGVDWESANKIGINATKYLGIPGKIASDFEGDLIKDFINKNILHES